MQRLGMYIADTEVVNTGSTLQPLALGVKTDTVASLENLFALAFSKRG
jgi:hypothetical protein